MARLKKTDKLIRLNLTAVLIRNTTWKCGRLQKLLMAMLRRSSGKKKQIWEKLHWRGTDLSSHSNTPDQSRRLSRVRLRSCGSKAETWRFTWNQMDGDSESWKHLRMFLLSCGEQKLLEDAWQPPRSIIPVDVRSGYGFLSVHWYGNFHGEFTLLIRQSHRLNGLLWRTTWNNCDDWPRETYNECEKIPEIEAPKARERQEATELAGRDESGKPVTKEEIGGVRTNNTEERGRRSNWASQKRSFTE